MITDYYKMAKKSSTSTRKRKRTKSKSKSASNKNKKVNFKKKIYRKAKKYNKKRVKQINVDASKQLTTHSYVKRNVSYKKQKRINNKFLNGYSPFSSIYTNFYQETTKTDLDVSKYYWITRSTLREVYDYTIKAAVAPGTQPGTEVSQANGMYVSGPDMSIYISKVKHSYEIHNPTNYDQTLVIYDVVCKNDTLQTCESSYFNTANDNSIRSFNYTLQQANQDYDPISLMKLGEGLVRGTVPAAGNVLVSDSTDLNFNDIKFTPTMAYPFNIYWRVVRKHIFTLQPGATVNHVFTYRPKQLITRGYLGYKYPAYQQTNTNSTVPIGLRDITSGSLFKFWGQLVGSGDDGDNSKHYEVVNLGGGLTIKSDIQVKWYRMDPKYKFTFREIQINNDPDSPMDASNLEVINNVTIKQAQKADTDASNNKIPVNTS